MPRLVARSWLAGQLHEVAHLQPGKEGELRLRHAGYDADDAVDGAEQQRRQARRVAVRQLHHERPVPEAVDELPEVVLARNLRYPRTASEQVMG